MLIAKPKFPFSRDYRFTSNGKPIGEFQPPWMMLLSKTGRATLKIENKEYQVNLPYLKVTTLGHAESKLTLVEKDKNLAVVEYPNVNNTDLFLLHFDSRILEVKRTKTPLGSYDISEANSKIGQVRLPSILLRKKTVQLTSNIPTVIQAFVFLGTIYYPKIDASQ